MKKNKKYHSLLVFFLVLPISTHATDECVPTVQQVVHIDKPHWTAIATRIIASIAPIIILSYIMHRSQSPEGTAGVAESDATHYMLKEFVGTVPHELQALVEYIAHPSVRQALQYHGVEMSKGCILYGKPGVGKTFLARCIAGDIGVPCIAISASEIFNSPWMGSAVRNVLSLLEAAQYAARNNEFKTCILIFDEAESLLNKRISPDSPVAQEYNNAVNTLLSGIDGIKSGDNKDVLIYTIACTNSAMADLDPAVKRSGRFEAQIEVFPPNEQEALVMFQHYLKKFKVLPVAGHLPLSHTHQALLATAKLRIAETVEALYNYYLIKAGYISAADIKRSIERALVAVHISLRLSLYKKPWHALWNRWFSSTIKGKLYDVLTQQIDELRNSGELLEKVLYEINRQLTTNPARNASCALLLRSFHPC